MMLPLGLTDQIVMLMPGSGSAAGASLEGCGYQAFQLRSAVTRADCLLCPPDMSVCQRSLSVGDNHLRLRRPNSIVPLTIWGR